MSEVRQRKPAANEQFLPAAADAAPPVLSAPYPPNSGAPQIGDLPVDRRRIIISVLMQLAALIFLGHLVYTSGLAGILGSYWSKAYGTPCGLLPAKEFVLTSDRVVRSHGTYPGYVYVRGGTIGSVRTGRVDSDRQAMLQAFLRHHPGIHVIDYGSAVIAPGLIDLHVHMNEPGREDWEGMETATSAAAAGGVTTLIDMPLNSHPCTTTVPELKRKIALARSKAHVNMGFWAGLVPENAQKPRALKGLVGAGALGFKSFMAPSGIEDFPHVGPAEIEAALPTLRSLGVPLLVHAELLDHDIPQGGNPRKHSTWLDSRPRRFEKNAVRALVAALWATNTSATRPGFGVHVVHLADADLLPELRESKERGLPLTVETCPHYLNFAAEDVPDGDTRFKCAPPLRERENAQRLLAGLLDGTLDSLATDHSPSEPSLKRLEEGDFMKAWGGIAGLQYALPASWQPLQGLQHASLERLTELWSLAPARIAGLEGSKGRLSMGYDADLVVWAPEEWADTSPGALQHRHKATPYAGMQLRGRVLATFVRGSQVFDAQQGVAQDVCGGTVLKKRW